MYKTAKAARERLNACILIDSLTPEQARVEVALDVLAALKLGKLDASGGVYAQVPFQTGVSSKNMRTLLGHMSGPATVCGIGALMVAHVARFNEFRLGYFDIVGGREIYLDRDTITRHLRQVFDDDMLDTIEDVFELWADGSSGRTSLSVINDIEDRYPDAEERLVAIMRDIAENGGSFDPERLR